MGGTGLCEDVEDLLPDAALAPPGIASVHSFPRAKFIGEFPPGAASLDDPEDAGENQAVVSIRASDLGLLWWEQTRNSVPALIRQLEPFRVQPLDGGRSERRSLLSGPASDVAALGHGLVPSAKGRPGKPEAQCLGWFRDGEE